MDLNALNIEEVAANSFRDFHAKGLDYLCLSRSADWTAKAYFFDADVSALPEVVIPHNHRYDFETTVLAGRVCNRSFGYVTPHGDPGEVYEHFDYLTPLNGGDGFHWREQVRLRLTKAVQYERGGRYGMRAESIHTIQIGSPQTVLLLGQGGDVVPIGAPTKAFRLAGSREAPSLSGLYREMDVDHARKRIEQLRELMP